MLRMTLTALGVALAILFFGFALARAYDHERAIYCTLGQDGTEVCASR